MTKQTTPKRPKADPHEIARSIVHKHLEGILFAETELTRRHNRLHEAIPSDGGISKSRATSDP